MMTGAGDKNGKQRCGSSALNEADSLINCREIYKNVIQK